MCMRRSGRYNEGPVPRALSTEEVSRVVGDYASAARLAMHAGFDGAEVHAANGYLIDQFLHDATNTRTDRYGGSIENRARFLLEVLHAVVGVYGPGRVGVRLSPSSQFNDMTDSDPVSLFTHVVQQLNTLPLAYLHTVEPGVAGSADAPIDPYTANLTAGFFRKHYTGTLISCGLYDRDKGMHAVSSGQADMVAYGRWFISNPDLPRRLRDDLALTPYDRAMFYLEGARGYTDYPPYQDQSS